MRKLPRAITVPRDWWRSSLTLRVVSSTLVLSFAVVALVGALLLGRITSGLLDAKERSALSEAAAGLVDAQRRLDAVDTANVSPAQLVDTVTGALAQRAGTSGLYEVLLLASPPRSPDAPERGTFLVSEGSIPAEMRATLAEGPGPVWTYHPIDYLDGRSVPGLLVGAGLAIPTVGPYELYFLFPMDGEQATLDLIQRTVLAVGAILVLTLGLIAFVVTRQVVSPVRMAARTAERLAGGHLTERMSVRGADDLARLAHSFNQMAAGLADQIRRLESLSRFQQRFVSDVSHELRTPLTTVRMAADLIHDARADFDPATARSAELLQAELGRFETLLADLLEISRYDAGVVVLDRESTDLVALVQRVLDVCSALATARETTVEFIAPAEPVIVALDARRIDRVLRNLVVNALEHSEGQPVIVTVAADTAAAAVSVRDYGVGLRPGESSLMFNRFWRADPARARTTGGTGLGLAIALEDAHRHGGWLQAWGAPGVGTNVRLTLPLVAGDAVETSPLPLEPDDATATAHRGPYARRTEVRS